MGARLALCEFMQIPMMEIYLLEQQFGSIRDVHLGDLGTVPANRAVELLLFEIGNGHETADVAHMYSERIGRILIMSCQRNSRIRSNFVYSPYILSFKNPAIPCEIMQSLCNGVSGLKLNHHVTYLHFTKPQTTISTSTFYWLPG